MTEKIKKTTEDAKAMGRGIKKVFKVTVAVVEAFAWLGLLFAAYAIIYHNFKGYFTVNEYVFYVHCVTTAVITVRAGMELGRYFKQVGCEYER